MNTAFINMALLRRHMLPMDGYVSCPCCGDTQLDRSDMASEESHTTAPALALKYGAPVCLGCADNHRECDDCGKPFPSDELALNADLDIRLCESCCDTSDGHVRPVNAEVWA